MRSAHPKLIQAGFLAVAFIAVIGGLALRFYAQSPLWLDEALSTNIASLGVGDMVSALRRDGHPLGYYLLLKGWMEIFGNGDTAARALSGVAAVGSVTAIAAVAHRIMGRNAAAIAAVLALASPFLMRYGTEARMYALVSLTVAVGWWFVLAALDEPKPSLLVGVAASTAVLVNLHYWAIFVVAAAFVVLVVIRAWRVLMAGLFGAATFAFWLPVFFDQLAHTGTPWAPMARPPEIIVESMQAIGGGVRPEPILLGLFLMLAVFIGALAGPSLQLDIRQASSAHGATAMLVGTLALGSIAALATGASFESRYAAVIMPFVIVLATRALTLLSPIVGLSALAVLVVLGLVVGAVESQRDRTQGKEIAAVINELGRPGDTVLWCPDQLGPSVDRYLTLEANRTTFPHATDPGIIDWYDYLDVINATDPALFADQIAAGTTGRIWMVSQGSYLGFEGKCEIIINRLSETFGIPQILIGPRDVFEPAELRRFEPAS